MSLIKKSDVKDHLSTRTGRTSIFPFAPAQPEPAPDLATTARESVVSEPGTSVSSDAPITPEAVSNAVTVDSAAIPAKVGSAGSPS